MKKSPLSKTPSYLTRLDKIWLYKTGWGRSSFSSKNRLQMTLLDQIEDLHFEYFTPVYSRDVLTQKDLKPQESEQKRIGGRQTSNVESKMMVPGPRAPPPKTRTQRRGRHALRDINGQRSQISNRQTGNRSGKIPRFFPKFKSQTSRKVDTTPTST